MKLVAVADEACDGVGAPRDQAVDQSDHFLDSAYGFLTELGTLVSTSIDLGYECFRECTHPRTV